MTSGGDEREGPVEDWFDDAGEPSGFRDPDAETWLEEPGRGPSGPRDRQPLLIAAAAAIVLLLLGVGIVIGLAFSQMTNRLVVSHVVMKSADADVLWSGLGAVAVIALVGLAACLIPARRVLRMSPMAALRQD